MHQMTFVRCDKCGHDFSLPVGVPVTVVCQVCGSKTLTFNDQVIISPAPDSERWLSIIYLEKSDGDVIIPTLTEDKTVDVIAEDSPVDEFPKPKPIRTFKKASAKRGKK